MVVVLLLDSYNSGALWLRLGVHYLMVVAVVVEEVTGRRGPVTVVMLARLPGSESAARVTATGQAHSEQDGKAGRERYVSRGDDFGTRRECHWHHLAEPRKFGA
jgi:hypothetical protein